MSQTIAVIKGDGIGPEIMDAALAVLDALNVGSAVRIRRCRIERLRKDRRTAAGSHLGRHCEIQSGPEKPVDHAGRRRLFLDQRGPAPQVRPVRQRASGDQLSEHQVALREHRPDHRAREHRRRLHRRRPKPVRRRRNCAADPENHPQGFRAHRALCVRHGARHRPQENHRGSQGQHPEVDLRPVPESGP